MYLYAFSRHSNYQIWQEGQGRGTIYGHGRGGLEALAGTKRGLRLGLRQERGLGLSWSKMDGI